MKKLSLIEQDGGFILESREEVRIVDKRTRAFLMTLKDIVDIFMIAVCLCYVIGDKAPNSLTIVAILYLYIDVAVLLYKRHLRSL